MQLPAVTDGSSTLLKKAYATDWLHLICQKKVIKQLHCKQNNLQNNYDQEKQNLPVLFCRIPFVGA